MATASSASFEDELLALNPEYDLVFGKNNNNNEIVRNESPHALEPNGRWSSPHKMKIISKMNEILNAKPLGELPTQNDWEETQSVEVETITLMRKLGLEQSIDRAPDESRTISTVPVSDDVIVMKNGRKKMSIFMADTYFEMKPRSEASFDLDSDNFVTAEDSTTSDISQDLHIYQPIFESTLSTASTSLSEDREDDDEYEKPSPSRVPYKQMNSQLSSESDNRRRSFDNNNAVGWTRVKPSNDQPQFGGNNRTSHSRDSGTRRALNDSGASSSSGSSCFGNSNTKSNNRRSRRSNQFQNLSGVSPQKHTASDSNWRLNMGQPRLAKPELPNKAVPQLESPKLNETVTIPKEASKPSDVSNCGRPLYKPKDLFIKKKAMLIQQVLAEYQS